MPLNESAGIRRSNLTKEQKREAEAAIYGLSTNDMSPQTEPTYEEFLQWRAQHAAQNGRPGTIKEFDLNNPPKLPYVHQEYPKMLYNHERRVFKVVQGVEQEQAALEAGWRNDPYPAELPAEPELEPAEAAEAAQLDRIARRPRRPRE